MVGGFWIAALAAAGRVEQAKLELAKLARVCALRHWAFTEWLHGKTLAPRGMPGQSWNAAAFLMAEHMVSTDRTLFAWGNTRAASRPRRVMKPNGAAPVR